MKNTFYSLFAILMIAFFSTACTKERDCYCTTYEVAPSGDTQTEKDFIGKLTEKSCWKLDRDPLTRPDGMTVYMNCDLE